MKKILGIIGLIIVTIIWGGGFVASDIALKELSPFTIMFFRFLIAAVLMGLLANKKITTITKDELLCGFVLGTALFAGFALQIVGLKYTTPSKNAFLPATNVLLVPIIAYFIGRKKLDKKSIAGSVMALVGVGILSLQSNFSVGIGDLLTERIRPSILNFLQMLTAFILSFLGLLFSGGIILDVSRQGIYAIIYLGAISTTLCYFLQTTSQQYVDETKAAIILSMESVFGTLFSVLILSEKITPRMIIGGIMILSAVLISELKFKKRT